LARLLLLSVHSRKDIPSSTLTKSSRSGGGWRAQIPAFKKADKTLTVDLSGKQLLVRSNAFIEFFDYDRGTSDDKVRGFSAS
jgi:hypothetical protein